MWFSFHFFELGALELNYFLHNLVDVKKKRKEKKRKTLNQIN